MLRRDPEATLKAGFADKRSYISFDGHRYLFGEDAKLARNLIYARDKAKCHYCGKISWPSDSIWDSGQLHHLKGGYGSQRCWCDHNLVWACGPCHRKQHVRVGGRK